MHPVKHQANPHLYTIPEVAEILRCGVGRTYELAKAKTFPVIRIGSRIRVPKNKFHEWLDSQSQSSQRKV